MAQLSLAPKGSPRADRSRSPLPRPISWGDFGEALRLTDQQEEIVAAIAQGRDVRVIAHAGSGKTKTVVVALRVRLNSEPDFRALFLAYNRSVKEDVRKKLWGHRSRALVHSYDSALTEYYDPGAPTKNFQLALQELLDQEELAPMLVRGEADDGAGLSFDLLVVDEAQDLDRSYLRLILKLLRDNARGRASVVAVGDPKQAIYGYRGASWRYFLEDGELYQGRSPRTLVLSRVFRFHYRICDFVNRLCEPLFRSLKATHWPEGHQPAGEEEAPLGREVFRYVLPEAEDAVPLALLQRIRRLRSGEDDGEAPPAGSARGLSPSPCAVVALTGSRRESNSELWKVMEQLQSWEPEGQQHLVTEMPEHQHNEEVTVFLSNAHPAKGQTYRNVVVFFTNERTWFKKNAREAASCEDLHAEIIYVALTRCERTLIVVESRTSLLMQKIADAARGGGGNEEEGEGQFPLPPALCAVTGLHLGFWVEPAAGEPRRRRAPRKDSLAQFLERDIDVEALAELSSLLEMQRPPRAWQPRDGPRPDKLEVYALWARHDWSYDRAGPFAPLFEGEGLGASEENLATAYARLTGARACLFGPRLKRALLRLQSQPPEAWGWVEWLELARLHPELHYGHSYAPLRDDRGGELDGFWAKLQAAQERVCGRRPSSECYPLKRPYGLDVFLSQDEEAVEVLVLEGTSSERPTDHLVAACAALSLQKETYTLRYVSEGESARGSLPGTRREAFREAFRRALAR